MICTVKSNSEDRELTAGEVTFRCECDDGRLVLVTGGYFERFHLPEILSRIAAQLANSTIEIAKPVRAQSRRLRQNGNHETPLD